MSYSPYVALVRKVHTPCNVHQKLASRLDNHEQYRKNYQGLARLLQLRYLVIGSRQLLVGNRQILSTIK